MEKERKENKSKNKFFVIIGKIPYVIVAYIFGSTSYAIIKGRFSGLDVSIVMGIVLSIIFFILFLGSSIKIFFNIKIVNKIFDITIIIFGIIMMIGAAQAKDAGGIGIIVLGMVFLFLGLAGLISDKNK